MKNKWRINEERNEIIRKKKTEMMGEMRKEMEWWFVFSKLLEASRSFQAWNSQWGSATGARGSGWMVAPNPSNFEPVRSFEAKKWAKKKAIWNMNFIENGSENVLTISAAEMWELFQ